MQSELVDSENSHEWNDAASTFGATYGGYGDVVH